MIDGLLALIVLSVAAVLACFRFAGCVLPTYESTPDYGDTVKGEIGRLISYWRLNELERTGVGAQAKDEMALNHGTYQAIALTPDPSDEYTPGTPVDPILSTGQPTIVPEAPSNHSVRVDGGFVHVAHSPLLNQEGSKAFSVEAWVHPEWSADETNLFRCVVASRNDASMIRFGYILYAGPVLDPNDLTVATDPTMHWQAWVGDGSTPLWRMLVGPPVQVDETTYLLLTYDGGLNGGTLTLDAMPISLPAVSVRLTKENTSYSPNTSQPLFIGMGAPELSPPRYPFRGRLQEVAFYNDALSKDKAIEHFKAGKGSE